MYRLTERDEYGNADIIALSDMMPEIYAELSFSETNALTEVLNRLADYEDTELSPDVCANYKKFEDEAISKGVPFKRIVELMDAEEQGRLVVLPCKVGDTVYYLDNGVQQTKLLAAAVNLSRRGIVIEGYTQLGAYIKRSVVGETIFLTREEAEAALKAKGDI